MYKCNNSTYIISLQDVLPRRHANNSNSNHNIGTNNDATNNSNHNNRNNNIKRCNNNAYC